MKDIDWGNLSFSYMDTGAFVKAEYHDAKWGKIEKCTDAHMPLHIAATSLHYGQSCFEGLKTFTMKNGEVAIFRPEENARRMFETADRLMMVGPPEELFVEACYEAVRLNRDYVPPYGTGASMYLRPLLIGTTPRVGVQAAEDFLFVVLAMPVGPYYKNGFFPVKSWVQEKYDRAAPHGLGHVKAAANYVAGLKGDYEGKKLGYPICMYVDSAEHKYIEEFGTSNFVGITADKKYITPASDSILKSITNKSLQTLAEDMGYTVERRLIAFDELSKFSEVGACGTAAVITPIHSVTRGDKTITFGSADKAGEVLTAMFKELQGIQYGDVADRHGWMKVVK